MDETIIEQLLTAVFHFFGPQNIFPLAAPNYRQRFGARGKAGRARRPIGRPEPTIQDVLQASEENEQLLRRELKEREANRSSQKILRGRLARLRLPSKLSRATANLGRPLLPYVGWSPHCGMGCAWGALFYGSSGCIC